MTTICDKFFANRIPLKTVVLLFYQSVCAGNYCQATLTLVDDLFLGTSPQPQKTSQLWKKW